MKKIVTIAATAIALISTPAFANISHHPHHRQHQMFAPYDYEYDQQFEAGAPYQEYRRRYDGNNFQNQWNDGN